MRTPRFFVWRVYIGRPRNYVIASLYQRIRNGPMRIEIENIVDEIKQAISLLRRHL